MEITTPLHYNTKVQIKIERCKKSIASKQLRESKALFNDLDSFESKIESNLLPIYFLEMAEMYLQFSLQTRSYSDANKAIKYFEKIKIKFSSEEFHWKFLSGLANATFISFRLKKEHTIHKKHKKFIWNDDSIRLVQHSKKIFLELINEKYENKNFPNSLFQDTLIGLSQLTADINRWSESFYYLGQTKSKNPDFSFYYISTMIYNSFSSNVCSDEVNLPSYHKNIVYLSNLAIEHKETTPEYVEIILKMRQESLNQLNIKSIPMEELEEMKDIELKDFLKHTKYRQFILKNGLGISDHSIYCSCSLSGRDYFPLKNKHVRETHKGDKLILDKFQALIDQLILSFSHARNCYYQASSNSFKNIHSKEFKFELDSKQAIEDNLHIESFKSCYGILDKIALGLVDIYDTKTIISLNKVYFHSLFKAHNNLIYRKIFQESQSDYLVSLYSLSQDLGDNGALKEFKQWRNKIEHGLVFLSDDTTNDPRVNLSYVSHVIAREEFTNKLLLLLQLTRSAIFSFGYLLRRKSK